MRVFILIFFFIHLCQLSFAKVHNVNSSFLQYLDFEAPIPIYTEDEVAHLKLLIQSLLDQKVDVDCRVETLDYNYRVPELEELKGYLVTSGWKGFLNGISHSLYGDVWQFEELEGKISCPDHIKNLELSHYIEDGVKKNKFKGMVKVEDYWMEVRVRFHDSRNHENSLVALYFSESDAKAGIGTSLVERSSLTFDIEP